MASNLRDDIDSVMSNVSVPEPIFKLSHLSNKQAVFICADSKPKIADEFADHPLVLLVRPDVSIRADGFHISNLDANHASYQIYQQILEFIETYSKNTNPKLSALYRHYRDNRRNIITDDLYTLWKYMKSSDLSDARHVNNIMAILEVLKERENK